MKLLFFVVLWYFINSQEIDIEKAIQYLEEHLQPEATEECGTYVGNALNAAGFNIRTTNRYAYLFYYDDLLINAGFSIIGNLSDIPVFERGDIMVNLNTTLHKDGHICMYNGSKWLSDFAQKSIYTYSNELDIPTYFFRYQKNASVEKCECYKGYIEDDLYLNDECSQMIMDFLMKNICPLISVDDITEEEIDNCEMNYFCGEDKLGDSHGESKYINFYFSIFIIFILIFLWIK